MLVFEVVRGVILMAAGTLATCGRVGFGTPDEVQPVDAAADSAVPDTGSDLTCPRTFALPPTSSFTDDFSSGSLPPNWSAGGCAQEVGGELVATPTGGSGKSYCYPLTAAHYHLACDRVFVHIPEITTPELGAQTFIYVIGSGAEPLEFFLEEEGFLSSGPNSNIEPYDAVADAWWQMRESDGTLFFETSPDGSAWATLRQVPDLFDLDDVVIGIGAGTYEQVTNPGEARFHCYNVPPPCD